MMKLDPVAAAAAVENALRINRGPEEILPIRTVAILEITDSKDSIGVVVASDALPLPHLAFMPAGRKAMPPAVASTMATAMIADYWRRTDLAEHVGKAHDAMAPVRGLVGDDAMLVFDCSDMVHTPGITLVAQMLDQTLRRIWCRVQGVVHAPGPSTAANSFRTEERRHGLLAAGGGSRRDALTCCPVSAAAIHEDPDKWRPIMADALLGRSTGMRTFNDGRFQPAIQLGPGVRWHRTSLILRNGLPQAVLASLPGRPLADVVRHRFLPGGLQITAIAQQHSSESTYVRTDVPSIPLGPVLDMLGLEA